MDWNSIGWDSLERLRERFLAGSSGGDDYWSSESDLASYDQTFARRIAWKWDFVLGELDKLGWRPPAGPVVDWGCGSGVAGRTFIRHFGWQCGSGAGSGPGPARPVNGLVLLDRSALAMRFAARRAAEEFPGLSVETASPFSRTTEGRRESCPDSSPAASSPEDRPPSESSTGSGAILLSHVLTELDTGRLDLLLDRLRQATCVIWVEPGTHRASRALIGVRERLAGAVSGFNIIAPCTHANRCPMLQPGNEPHWCHQFAHPPAEAFTDGEWVRFGRLMGIDLRSLPLSFLVLEKRDPPSELPADARECDGRQPLRMRIIGRPRISKAFLTLFGCDATGLAERRLVKRRLPEQFRRFRRNQFDTLQTWSYDNDDITQLDPPDV